MILFYLIVFMLSVAICEGLMTSPSAIIRPRFKSDPSPSSIFSRLNAGVFNDVSGSISPHPIRIAYQGEPGAYSEKAAKELLGPRILTVNYPSFEDAFRAVANKDVDYAVLPIENSLGGSIHANFDLLLRYDLNIIAEHEFKVEHFLLAQAGVQKKDIKRVMSHPQALAQCDNYLTNLGVIKEAAYDTAGSAKLIKEKNLTDAAAIASDIAAVTYGLEILDRNIEDHDINFTRFLLLGRQSVSGFLNPQQPAKTSIVFVLPDNPGALYKALACFSLRDIDCCKIESRPTSVELLQYLQFKSKSSPLSKSDVPVTALSYSDDKSSQDLPRFRYTFHLDFLASEFDDNAQNALHHLREQSTYLRVLGSYPVGGKLIGPVKHAVDSLSKIPLIYDDIKASRTLLASVTERSKPKPLKIGIIGFGKFGQFLAKTFVKNHKVYCLNKGDMSSAAKSIGCEYFPLYDTAAFAKADLDVILLSVSIISFEEVVRMLPKDIFKNKLVVDVLSVKSHPKNILMSQLPESSDILCTHPMFGPESGKYGWQGLPFLYDKIRINDPERCNRFLSIWEKERCKMIEMSCEQHDEYAANSQFITHLTGRILWEQNLVPTPIDTKGFQTVLNLVDNTCKDSFDLFFGLYYYNSHASNQLRKIRDALAEVERQLASKEAYLAAKNEISTDQRSRVLEECRSLIREALITRPDTSPEFKS